MHYNDNLKRSSQPINDNYTPSTITHMQASSAGSRGDTDTKRKYKKISMTLTVIAIVTQVLEFIIVVGTAAGIVASGASAARSIVTSCSSRYCFG